MTVLFEEEKLSDLFSGDIPCETYIRTILRAAVCCRHPAAFRVIVTCEGCPLTSRHFICEACHEKLTAGGWKVSCSRCENIAVLAGYS